MHAADALNSASSKSVTSVETAAPGCVRVSASKNAPKESTKLYDADEVPMIRDWVFMYRKNPSMAICTAWLGNRQIRDGLGCLA
jgi:hypothetical protein